MIIVSTTKGDTITPATANLLQGEIGAHCPAFDVNAACSGFLYALDLAQAYIDSGKAKRILITCAEAISRLCDWTDRSTCVLFGDGAGAAVAGEGEGLLATRLTSTPNVGALNAYHDPGNNPFQEHKHPASYLHMAGQEVFKFAVSTSSADLRAVAEAAGNRPLLEKWTFLYSIRPTCASWKPCARGWGCRRKSFPRTSRARATPPRPACPFCWTS